MHGGVGAERGNLPGEPIGRGHYLVICVVNMLVLSAKTVIVALETTTSILLAIAAIFAASFSSTRSRSFSTRTLWPGNVMMAASVSCCMKPGPSIEALIWRPLTADERDE